MDEIFSTLHSTQINKQTNLKVLDAAGVVVADT